MQYSRNHLFKIKGLDVVWTRPQLSTPDGGLHVSEYPKSVQRYSKAGHNNSVLIPSILWEYTTIGPIKSAQLSTAKA